jgi:hypothetical protein
MEVVKEPKKRVPRLTIVRAAERIKPEWSRKILPQPPTWKVSDVKFVKSKHDFPFMESCGIVSAMGERFPR